MPDAHAPAQVGEFFQGEVPQFLARAAIDESKKSVVAVEFAGVPRVAAVGREELHHGFGALVTIRSIQCGQCVPVGLGQ